MIEFCGCDRCRARGTVREYRPEHGREVLVECPDCSGSGRQVYMQCDRCGAASVSRCDRYGSPWPGAGKEIAFSRDWPAEPSRRLEWDEVTRARYDAVGAGRCGPCRDRHEDGEPGFGPLWADFAGNNAGAKR